MLPIAARDNVWSHFLLVWRSPDQLDVWIVTGRMEQYHIRGLGGSSKASGIQLDRCVKNWTNRAASSVDDITACGSSEFGQCCHQEGTDWVNCSAHGAARVAYWMLPTHCLCQSHDVCVYRVYIWMSCRDPHSREGVDLWMSVIQSEMQCTKCMNEGCIMHLKSISCHWCLLYWYIVH